MRLSVEFSLAAILAIILFFVARKDNAIVNILLLAALFFFCVHPLLSSSWITGAQPLLLRIWKIATVFSIALIAVGWFGIWVWPATPAKAQASNSQTADYPDIQFKQSEQQAFRGAYAITATVACFRNDSVIGQNLSFEAQIIYKDAGGSEIANVARGIWFPTNSSHPYTTTFNTGVPRSLGIFFMQEWIFYKPIADWVREHLVVSYTLFPRFKFEEFSGNIASIEIRLLSGTHRPKSFVLDVSDYGKENFPKLLLRRD